MRSAALSIIVLTCLYCPGLQHLLAADETAVTIQAVASGSPASKQPLSPLYFFGDQPLKFDAGIAAPLGSHVEIHADLFQTSAGGLTGLLLKNIALSPVLFFAKCTQCTAPCALPALPAIKRPTKTLLKIYARIQGQPNTPQLAGILEIFLYPRHTPAEWKKIIAAILAEAGLDRLAVFGKEDALRHFLQSQQVPFDNLGPEWPAAFDARRLYLAGSPPTKPDSLPPLAGVRIALFNPETAGIPMLPGVYPVADSAGGALVKVTLPGVLEHLNDDPRSQQIFLEILRQTLHPEAPVEDSTSTWP